MRLGALRIAVRLMALTLTALICTAPAALAGNWVTLTVPCTFSGTLPTPTPLPPGITMPPPECFYGFNLHLDRAQTVVATFTAASDVGTIRLVGGAPSAGYNLVADTTTSFTRVLGLSSDSSQTCYLMAYSSKPGTFTLEVADAPPAVFAISSMKMPSRVRRRRKFHVSASLSDYNGFSSPIRFTLDRKLRGRWRPYSSAAGDEVYGSDGMGHWGYSADLRLPRGTFRVRARFRDAAHPVARYNKWKTVVVR